MSANVNHPNLSRLKGNGDIIIADPAVSDLHLRYTIPQVRLFCNFDRTLRSKKFDWSVMAFPGGYDDFTSLWNRAKDVPFQFCTLDKGDKTVIHGEHPDPDLIAPLPPTPTTNGPQYSEDQQEVIEWMKWSTMRAHCRRDQRIASSKAQAKAKREREVQERHESVIGGTWIDEANVGAGFKKQRIESSALEAGPSGEGSKNQTETKKKTRKADKGKGPEEITEEEQVGRKDADTHMSEE